MRTAPQPEFFRVDDEAKLEPVSDPGLIILLDLDYTLVANSEFERKTGGRFSERISRETYRLSLIELIKGHTVLLCTARKEEYRDITLKMIARKCGGWQPHEAYFNATAHQQDDAVKALYLARLIFRKYGKPDEQRYYAIESSARTRIMYSRCGISADPVGKIFNWTRLPYFDSDVYSL